MAVLNIDRFFSNLKLKMKRVKARAYSKTFRSSADTISEPSYTQHRVDLFNRRQSDDSRALLRDLFKHDPDVSAAVGAYLTLADTPVNYIVYSHEGEILRDETKILHKLLRALTTPIDYSAGYSSKTGLDQLNEELRYMTLLRGSIAGELVFDKNFIPDRIIQVDTAELRWKETESGKFKPIQKSPNAQDGIDLNIPNFFVAYHRKDPTSPYSHSEFVSAINTIAARSQVINDLYRLMQLTGFPRIKVKVLEQVLKENAPADVAADPTKYRDYMNAMFAQIQASFQDIRPDQPMIHFDSYEVSMLNEENPAMSVDISAVIEVLNSQNQAALKTMATVIGRGTAGVNTASVEARIQAMNADQLNKPLKEYWQKLLTFLINTYGISGYVEVTFAPCELRPDYELEPNKTLRSQRLRADLSDGIITDEFYHLSMYGRLPPESAPTLSGTGFYDKSANSEIEPADIASSKGSLERSVGAAKSKQSKSNNKK